MDRPLDMHVAVVTGASRGIGRAAALKLAEAGAAVALIARDSAALEAVAREVSIFGTRALVLPVDITDDHKLEEALQHAVVHLGSVSILVNAAGVAPPRTMHTKAPIAEWDRMLATCLRAPMVLSRMLLPDMLVHQRGLIVNIASVAARRARPGEAAYAAAKAGLLAFSHTLFREVRNSGVKVSAICPGYVDTDFIPPNRKVDRDKFLRADDVADVIIQTALSPLHACPSEIILEPQFDPEIRTPPL